MEIFLILLLIQGFLGALDTLVYHEWLGRLPANLPHTRTELRLHAARDLIYGVLFLTLPFFHWQGVFAWALALLIALEIVITLADFVIEDRNRGFQGGIAPGERVMHTVMAILYGAFLAQLIPSLLEDAGMASGFLRRAPLPEPLGPVFVAMGIGVWVSGLRDWLAARAG